MMVVFTTVPSEEQGTELARKIVSAKLAACVQILPGMTSVYFWEGEIQTEPEHLLLIKTLRGKYDELETFIISNHSYDTPEIIAIETERVSEGYLKWLTDHIHDPGSAGFSATTSNE